MRKRIFRNLCWLALTAVLLTSALVSGVVYARTYGLLQSSVRREAQLIAAGIDAAGGAYLACIPHDALTRVTHIARDGTVLSDSAAAPPHMENHATRPEVAAVLAGAARGEDVRFSKTLGQQTFYVACALSDGTILRVAATTESAFGAVRASMPWLALIAALVLGLTLLLARRMASAIIDPLRALDPAHPEPDAAYEELVPLLARLKEQKRTVRRQMAELSARQEEFRTLSENMDEGLLLLGMRAEIFSLNRAACTVLGGDPTRDYTGQHLLLLCRDFTLQTLTKAALGGTRSEGTLTVGSRQYELIASPVTVEGAPRGALLLLLDVTARRQAEQLRREFSANVSHELKTPLTSISGYAELLENARVAPQDIVPFAARIHGEAGRLLALIEDIMKLSCLDEESAPPAREACDLLALAQQAAARLELICAAQGVSFAVEGASAMVRGAPSQLAELVYNLSENAVKYNRSGGSVTLSVENTPQGALFTVSDTGIGIPADAQDRVFERFYRVDKSRSKETGGTGLGLSIVKHIALLHGARLTLTSEEHHGTTVRVHFPPL